MKKVISGLFIFSLLLMPSVGFARKKSCFAESALYEMKKKRYEETLERYKKQKEEVAHYKRQLKEKTQLRKQLKHQIKVEKKILADLIRLRDIVVLRLNDFGVVIKKEESPGYSIDDIAQQVCGNCADNKELEEVLKVIQDPDIDLKVGLDKYGLHRDDLDSTVVPDDTDETIRVLKKAVVLIDEDIADSHVTLNDIKKQRAKLFVEIPLFKKYVKQSTDALIDLEGQVERDKKIYIEKRDKALKCAF